MFIFLTIINIFQFLIGSLVIYLTTRKIFKDGRNKLLIAVKISAVITLFGIVTQALLFVFSSKIFSDFVGVFIFNQSIKWTPVIVIMLSTATILELVIFYFLLKKYYTFSFLKNISYLIIINILMAILPLFFITPARLFIAQPFVIASLAMEPTLKNGEYIFIKMYDKNYKQGDIIVFRNIKDGNYLIKRIINVSSDNVYIVADDNKNTSQSLNTIGKDKVVGKYWFSPLK